MQLHIVFFSYLYSSPYYYMYTSFAVVAGDISHETDNIDEQVKNIRIQSNNIQETHWWYATLIFPAVILKLLSNHDLSHTAT